MRNGEAVVKALALGADFVFIGRPFLFAMGAAQYPGLRQMVELIREQVYITLAQIGCPDNNRLERAYVVDADGQALRQGE